MICGRDKVLDLLVIERIEAVLAVDDNEYEADAEEAVVAEDEEYKAVILVGKGAVHDVSDRHEDAVLADAVVDEEPHGAGLVPVDEVGRGQDREDAVQEGGGTATESTPVAPDVQGHEQREDHHLEQ